MADVKYENKSVGQLHAVADASHQKHKSVTGQVPGVRDESNDSDESDESDSRDPREGSTYYVTPPEP